MNNSQHSSPPELGLDVDENYEFSGSKLKISSSSSVKGVSNNNNTNNIIMEQNQQSSAVLSGTDVVSPLPGSPIASNAITSQNNDKNSYQSESKS